MNNDYFHSRLPEILEMIRNVKPLPEPIDVLPKLPVHKEEDFTESPYRKDGVINKRGYHEVWKNGEFITNADTKGEAWNLYWSERIA